MSCGRLSSKTRAAKGPKTLLVLSILCLFSPALSGADKKIFMAGAAKLEMTPAIEPFKDANKNGRWDAGETFEDHNGNGKWDPVWLAGYQGGRLAKGAHDELWVTALAMTDGEETALFVTVDLIGYLFDETAAVKTLLKKELSLQPSNVFICSTHNHSGPDSIGLWGPDGKTGKDQEYLNKLREQILKCAWHAVQNMKPARAAFGKVHYGRPIEDSRPPKVINDLLLSMRLVDKDSKTIATLVNYAMHAEVLDGQNFQVTSDYPGVLREQLEKKFGGVGIFIPADIGGMQSPFVLFHTFWSRNVVGKDLAARVVKSLEGQRPREIDLFKVNTEDILFPVENKRYIGAIESGQFGQSAQFIKKEGGHYSLPAEVGFIQIGPAQFLTLPGEAFPELGNVYRSKMSPDFPFVFGLCGNEIGYIVPNEEWNPEGYEENMSLGPRTADTLLKAIAGLFSKL